MQLKPRSSLQNAKLKVGRVLYLKKGWNHLLPLLEMTLNVIETRLSKLFIYFPYAMCSVSLISLRYSFSPTQTSTSSLTRHV